MPTKSYGGRPPGPLSGLLRSFRNLREKMGRPKKDEILNGPVYSVLFKLAWPLMISSLLQTLYNLFDTFWLGRLPGEEGKLALGAMSISWPFVFFTLSLGIGLGIAALALISQHTGARNFEEANRDAGQLYFVLIVLSIIMGAVGFLTTRAFLGALTGGGPIVDYGVRYLQVIFLGLPFLITFFAFSFIMRAWGDTITPMKLMLLSVTINVVLDPILIFGLGPFPHMGIRGAAIATVFARAVASLLAIHLLFSGKVGLKLELSYLKPQVKKIKKFFKIGIPATTARIGDSIGFIILMGLLANLPNRQNVLAAYGVGNRIINITFVVLGGFGMAMSTMVGQSLGADREDRLDEVTQKGLGLMVLFMAVISIFLFLFRRSLIGIFVPGKTEIINIGAEFLAILAIGGPFFAVFNGVSGILSGSGHTGQEMTLSLARLWALRLPLIFLFAFVLNWYSTGAWWGMVISNIIVAVLSLMIYKLGWWREKVIDEETVGRPAIAVMDKKEKKEES